VPVIEPAGGASGLARDAAWSYLALAIGLVSSTFIIAIGFRHLPDRLMGVYAIATSTTALIGVVDPAITLGISRNVARLAAGRGDADEQRRFITSGHSVLVAFGAAIVVIGVFTAVTIRIFGLAHLSAGVWALLALLAITFAAQLATAIIPATLTGYSDYFGLAVSATLAGATTLAVVAWTLPRLGLTGFGLGALAGLLAGRGYLLWRFKRIPSRLPIRPRRPTRRDLRALFAFAVPMLLLSLAGQVISWIDVVAIGAMLGASTAALYRVGSSVPVQAMGLVYRAYDVSYPRLSAGDDAWQLRATTLLTRVACAGSGVAFAGLIALRADIVRILTGGSNELAQLVLIIFSLAGAANVPAHGLGLLAIARGRQSLFTPLVCVEAAANVALTILLVRLCGAPGAAWATLTTLAVSNLLVMPMIVRRAVQGTLSLVLGHGLLPLLLGGIPAAVIFELTARGIAGPPRIMLIVLMTCFLAAAAALAAAGSEGRRVLVSSFRTRKATA
jgi:O-antigen/teichoic acid export membrane protein